MTTKEKIIESLLYLKGSEGLRPIEIVDLLNLETEASAKSLIRKYALDFNSEKRGLIIEEFDGIYKMSTTDEVSEYVQDFATNHQKSKLSDSALEVVGIIAFKAPITKSAINAIRAKSSEHIVASLLLKGLIEEVGISKTPGNPSLFGVTNKFYDYFRIRSLNELPRLIEFSHMDLSAFEEDEEIIDLYGSQREEAF